MKIMGFAYKKGVGKNTLSTFVSTIIRCTRPDIIIKEVSFAAKLKDISYQLYCWAGLQRGQYYENHRDMKEKTLQALGLAPRDIWIGVGNALREVYGMTWVDYTLRHVSADILLVTDVRFINEALAIQAQRGKLVKIIRERIPLGTDPAEVDLDTWHNWDHTINNNGTLAELNTCAEVLVKELLDEK